MLLELLLTRDNIKETDWLLGGLVHKQRFMCIVSLAGAHPATSVHIRNISVHIRNISVYIRNVSPSLLFVNLTVYLGKVYVPSLVVRGILSAQLVLRLLNVYHICWIWRSICSHRN
jgi:hypothetical protein